MSRKFAAVAPLVSVTLALSFLAGCGTMPSSPTPTGTYATSKSVKMEAAARKETRAQAESRAKRYIAEFNDTAYRSIRSRTEMVQKIARTDADAAYEFLLQEIDDLQELRGEMKKITAAEAEEYEEMLLSEIDEMTPDQEEVKKRVAKSKALAMDLDELTIIEERSGEATVQGRARVGSRNRVLTAIQESKIYKFVSKAAKNTRKKVKKAVSSIWKKLKRLFG